MKVLEQPKQQRRSILEHPSDVQEPGAAEAVCDKAVDECAPHVIGNATPASKAALDALKKVERSRRRQKGEKQGHTIAETAEAMAQAHCAVVSLNAVSKMWRRGRDIFRSRPKSAPGSR